MNDYVKAIFLSLTFGATEIIDAFVRALEDMR